MPTYITLVRFTDDGRDAIADLPDHVEEIAALKRSLGGEPKGFYLTFGQYDMVAVSEMPDAEATAKVQLSAAMGGHADTETLRAFRMDELEPMLEEMPDRSA
jgi:uncharacterized protein with GYD domain